MTNRNPEIRKHDQDAERARQQKRNLPPEKRNELEQERERKLPGEDEERVELPGQRGPGAVRAEEHGQAGGRRHGTEKRGRQEPSPQRQGETKEQESDVERELEPAGRER
jgi:hypothetical protein